MFTSNTITIHAPVDLVYDLAADVCHWPLILAHYRFVDVLQEREGGSEQARRVRMGAWRGRVPVTWTAVQQLFPNQYRIEYHHISGATRGMDVVWRLGEYDSAIVVTIEHELVSPVWWIRPRLASDFVGKAFVMNIADRTLRGIKTEAERRQNGLVDS